MKKKELVERIKQILEGELPGDKAHQEMVPDQRVSAYDAIKQNLEFRSSAVAIVISQSYSTYKGILIKRTRYKGAHSGQIAFPGGKQDPEDKDLLDTAVREAREEVALQLKKEHLLGALTPVYIPVSRFMVQPYLFLLDELPDLIREEKEVDEIITFDTRQFISEVQISYTTIQLANGRSMENVPYFNIGGETVWGATALMLNELKMILKNLI